MISGTYIRGMTDKTEQANKLLKPTTFPQFFADFFSLLIFVNAFKRFAVNQKIIKRSFFVSDCGTG